MTALVFQMGFDKKEKEDFIEVIDEIVLRGEGNNGVGVHEMCDYIKDNYDVSWCYFVGDSFGVEWQCKILEVQKVPGK